MVHAGLEMELDESETEIEEPGFDGSEIEEPNFDGSETELDGKRNLVCMDASLSVYASCDAPDQDIEKLVLHSR